MHGKKPVSKTSKAKRPTNGKTARRTEARKAAPVSHKSAGTAKPAAKSSSHSTHAAHGSHSGHAAHSPQVTHSTHTGHSNHGGHAERNDAAPTNHAVATESGLERIASNAVLADTATGETLADATQVAANDTDESESSEPGSLLSGPRNVKPYVARRGEQYMGKSQLAHFQQILSNWKRDLMEEVDRTVSHMKDEAANCPDPNDRATQEEEFSLELRTRDRERKLIRKIDEALKRIEDGTYGYCLETGEEIGIKRLEARPVATLSIEAQERRERRERQYGDRDDRYR